jgi:PBP1b-binding outer membrane lipoprotein LpoB
MGECCSFYFICGGKMKRIVSILCLFILLISGCSEQSFTPVNGVVENKKYEESYVEDTFIYIPDGSGGFMYIPSSDTVPEKYLIKVNNRSYDIKKDHWDMVNVGDEVSFDFGYWRYQNFVIIKEEK